MALVISNKNFVADAVLAHNMNKCIPHYRKEQNLVIIIPNGKVVEQAPEGYKMKKVSYRFKNLELNCMILEKYFKTYEQYAIEKQLWDTHLEYSFGTIENYFNKKSNKKNEIVKYLTKQKFNNNNFRIGKLR
jgi:hypothetical protein